MKYSVAAILALGVVSTHSLSYLESLSSVRPAISAPAPAVEPPFFFTNGAKDEPAAPENPSFFFTDGAADEPIAPAKTTGSYLDNLSGRGSMSSAPVVAAASSASYLDALGRSATTVSGPGMTSYLDALPKNSAPTGGPGLSSYASSLNQAASASYSSPTPAAPAVPEAHVEATDFVVAVAAGGNYLDALAAASTSGAPTGAGLTGYLDALPRVFSNVRGAGIRTYTDNLPITNTFAGTGTGMNTYTDNLSGGRSFSSTSFSPFGGAKSSTSFAMGSLTGKFDFSFVADADLLEKLKAAGGRRVRLTGKIISYN